MIDRFGPGVGHLNYLVVPGVGMIEFLTTNHLLGWGISVIFDLAFLPGGREFDIKFDIDRCVIRIAKFAKGPGYSPHGSWCKKT